MYMSNMTVKLIYTDNWKKKKNLTPNFLTVV